MFEIFFAAYLCASPTRIISTLLSFLHCYTVFRQLSEGLLGMWYVGFGLGLRLGVGFEGLLRPLHLPL